MPSVLQRTSDLFETVVKSGHCIGCGVCAAFDQGIRIKLDDYGRYVASQESEGAPNNLAGVRVCPFADGVPNEDQLARDVFGQTRPIDPHIGYHIATYAGWVVEGDFRASGSSGGIASWVLVDLMNRGLVDFVAHVTSEPAPRAGEPLFHFAISSTPEEIRSKAKSRYYPVEMSGVIAEMLQRPGRYAVVGVPCFIKALRLACRESVILKDRLAFAIGIVCGHLKTAAFAEMFAWQCGIVPSELRAIDFRTKLPGRTASNYAVTVSGERDAELFSVTKPTSDLFGSNWGHGFFKYKACDFCDDVVGETADISIGDAWLQEYDSDPRGTNVVVVRSQSLNLLLADAAAVGRLHLRSITVDKVVESQAGGFRHRRDGLAYRLLLEDEAGCWRPTKRIKPSANHFTPLLRKIYAMRYRLGQASHAAFAAAKVKGDLGVFIQAMNPLLARYERLYRRPLPLRILGRMTRFAASIINPKS